MPQATKISVENSFIGGLKTEFTGLNFPENACTDTQNCIFDITGNVTRRLGIDLEANRTTLDTSATGQAVSQYKWNNASGDGLTEIVIEQIGSTLNFYKSSDETTSSGLSQQLIGLVSLAAFIPSGSSNDPSMVECQYADGNGYLIVYNPYCDPFYCTYVSGTNTIISTVIAIQQRDFVGLPEPGVADTLRPDVLTAEHQYNLRNQGWSSPQAWIATSATAQTMTVTFDPAQTYVRVDQATGNFTYTVGTGLVGISGGQLVNISSVVNISLQGVGLSPRTYTSNITMTMTGTVASYNSGTGVLVLNSVTAGEALTSPVTDVLNPSYHIINSVTTTVTSAEANDKIAVWHSDIGNYPSNADVWFVYKDDTGVYDPGSTFADVQQPIARAAQGHYILNTFNQDRGGASGDPTLTSASTYIRPRTGVWFQGRSWYAGADSTVAASGDVPQTTWSENIYFSQIIVTVDQLGRCFQVNDPSDENLFNLLPSDGGVLNIPGLGACYKLFLIQNGLLVFGSNGIWFITGSQGIGFTANDYTITKISGVKSNSSTSFVNVNGMPIFWNAEGIYAVEAAQQGLGLTVNPLTVGTILSFYAAIPTSSKIYARGDYDPLNYEVKWLYKITAETDATDRYKYDGVLCLNTYTKAFYPWTIDNTNINLHGVLYVSYPGSNTAAPDPGFKYFVSYNASSQDHFTFASEQDDDYVDWASRTASDFNSYFVTGYRLHGQALAKWQPSYTYMYSNNAVPTAYKIQGIWDFANSGNSGKFSTQQVITNSRNYFGVVVRRHRIRGHGVALQLKVSSVTGMPFDIVGWAMYEQINAGV